MTSSLTQPSRPHRAQRGFTLIEVLVAVLVLSIGLLGVAALNTVSVRMNHGAYLRSQATNMAIEIVDSIRANRENADDYAIEEGDKQVDDCDIDHERPGSGSGTEVAEIDLEEWKNHLACLLPEGDGSIAITTDTAGRLVATVKVFWDEKRLRQSNDTSTEADSEFVFETEL